jgi:hypothetical protein
MPFNPLHYKKTWPALGSPGDPTASSVTQPASAISLLKGILASTAGGGGTIPDGSIAYEKIQPVKAKRLLGRWDVTDGTMQEIDPAPTMTFVGAKLDIAAQGVKTTHLADSAVTGIKVADKSLDLVAKGAAQTPFTLYGTGSNGFVQMTTPSAPLTFAGGVLTIANSSITVSYLADGAVTTPKLGDGAIVNAKIADKTIDLVGKTANTTPDKLFGTNGSGVASTINIGTGLSLSGGTLTSTGGTGGGIPDAPNDGVYYARRNLGWSDIGAAFQPVDGDLTALAAFAGTNAIPYRVGTNSWGTVTLGTNLSFISGTLNLANTALNVIGTLAPAADTFPYFTGVNSAALGTITAFGRTLVAATDAANAASIIGAQPLDPDLTSLASAASVNVMYYRSAANTWSPVSIGAGLTFSSGSLAASATLAALSTATAAADQVPYFTSGSAAGTFASTSFGRSLVSAPSAAMALTTLGGQPLDGDLTSLAAASGTNTIYYRSGTDTWAAVTIGTNMTFAGGVLSSTASGGGGGNVSNSGTPTSGQIALWTDATHIQGVSSLSNLLLTGTTTQQGSGANPNNLTLTGGAAGAPDVIAATGNDANVTIEYDTKGTGVHNFKTNTTTTQVRIAHVAGASTVLQLSGGVGQAAIQAVGGGAVNIVDANLSGAPLAVTPTPATDASQKVATTAFVAAAVGARVRSLKTTTLAAGSGTFVTDPLCVILEVQVQAAGGGGGGANGGPSPTGGTGGAAVFSAVACQGGGGGAGTGNGGTGGSASGGLINIKGGDGVSVMGVSQSGVADAAGAPGGNSFFGGGGAGLVTSNGRNGDSGGGGAGGCAFNTAVAYPGGGGGAGGYAYWMTTTPAGSYSWQVNNPGLAGLGGSSNGGQGGNGFILVKEWLRS